MYELISAFSTQRFCSIWKTISPWILHRKSQIFQHAFIFTSSLTFWSQFLSEHASFCTSAKSPPLIKPATDTCRGLSRGGRGLPFKMDGMVVVPFRGWNRGLALLGCSASKAPQREILRYVSVYWTENMIREAGFFAIRGEKSFKSRGYF